MALRITINLSFTKQEGQFGGLITSLKNNTTVHDLSISGLNLNAPQVRALIRAVGENESLRCVSLNRKRINDDDGADIAKNLTKNQTLFKLEMEDNNLGPKTAAEVANLIRENRFIRVIDLESNNLTNSGKESEGVIALAQVCLIVFNFLLNNNRHWLLIQICFA